MPINDRNLKLGTKLIGRYHKQRHSCDVVEGEGGKLRYRLADGRDFKSPSAAGMAITGHACDGWVFWSVETTVAPQPTETKAVATEDQKKTPIEAAPAGKKPVKVKKQIFRLPNQNGVPDGQVRWFCHGCAKSFMVAAGETPKACPQGHKVA
jgi:hypothetical protein